MKRTRINLALVASLLILASCSFESEIGKFSLPSTEDESPPPPASLDLLFVMDRSASMVDVQTALAGHFDSTVERLSTLPGGLPNLHIGFISDDMGAGGHAVPGCSFDGDAGTFQNVGMVAGCTAPTDTFLKDLIDSEGTRTKNYNGTLGEAFACIGTLGSDGCGFEQPLHAMESALEAATTDASASSCTELGGECRPHGQSCDRVAVEGLDCGTGEYCCVAPAAPANRGFIRDDAFLAIVFVTNEDDCSTSDSALFDPTDTSTYGEFSSFGRCTQQALSCDGMAIDGTPMTYANCEPVASGPLAAIADFADYVKDLKGDEENIFIGVLAGDRNGLTVEDNGLGSAQAVPSCTDGPVIAFPSYRLAAFAELFSSSSVTSLCEPDLSDAFDNIASSLHAAMLSAIEDGMGSDDGRSDSRDEIDQPEKTTSGCSATGNAGYGAWAVLLVALLAAAYRKRTLLSRP